MDKPATGRAPGVSPKPPTPPKPKTLAGSGSVQRTQPDSPRSQPVGVTEGVNGQQEPRAVPTRPAPRPRPRPIPAKRTSLAKKSPSPAPDDATRNSPQIIEPVIEEAESEIQSANSSSPREINTDGPVQSDQGSDAPVTGDVSRLKDETIKTNSVQDCDSEAPTAPETCDLIQNTHRETDSVPQDPSAPDQCDHSPQPQNTDNAHGAGACTNAAPDDHKKHQFTIIKVRNKQPSAEAGKPAETEQDLDAKTMESLPVVAPVPRPRTPPSAPAPAPAPRVSMRRKSMEEGSQPQDVFHESLDGALPLPDSKRVTRNPSYERALDDVDVAVVSRNSGGDTPATCTNKEVGLSSDSEGEIPMANDSNTTLRKGVNVEVTPKLLTDAPNSCQKGAAQTEISPSVSAGGTTRPSSRPLPSRKAPPPPRKPKTDTEVLDVEVKSQSIKRDRAASAGQSPGDNDGYLEPRKAKTRSTFYDTEYSYVDVPREEMKTSGKKAEKTPKRRKSGHFYDFITSKTRSRSKSDAKDPKPGAESGTPDSKTESRTESKSESKVRKREKTSSIKSSKSGERKSAGSVFYYEIADIVDDEKPRRHSEHIYQNYSDNETADKPPVLKPRLDAALGGSTETPTPPPRHKRKARRSRHEVTNAPNNGMSTDDDEIYDHEYVYPDDPCLDSVRITKKVVDRPPALPARSQSCVTHTNREEKKPALPPRFRSDGGEPDDENWGPPPSLPPKTGPAKRLSELGVATCNTVDVIPTSRGKVDSDASSSEDEEDGYIYPNIAPPTTEDSGTLKHKDSGISVSGPPMLQIRKLSQNVSDESGIATPEAKASNSATNSMERPKSWGVERDPQIYANVDDPDPARTLTRDTGTLKRSSSCSDLEGSTEVHYIPMQAGGLHNRISQSVSFPCFEPGVLMKRNISNLSAADSFTSYDSSNAESTFNSDNSEEDDLDSADRQIYQIKPRKHKVFYIAEEMMTSERAFVRVLRLINVDFRKMVSDMSNLLGRPIIPPTVLNGILRYLPQLQNFNEDLLNDLTHRMRNWDSNPCIADIFVKKGPFLKLYTSYIREFESMCTALADAKKRFPEFDSVVRQFEASPRCASLALKHYMLKPVQRIPQYRLLLTDYKKYLPSDSPDAGNIDTALAIVSEVADHANQSMSYGDNVQKLLEIQQSLIGQFEVIRPGRCLLKEGILQKLSRKEMQPRKFFLLNDVLLYTTPVGSGSYKLNNALGLTGMRVCLPTKEDFQNEFSIISTQRSFTISAKTAEERDEWLSMLQNAIKDNIEKRCSFQVSRQHDPALVSIEIEKDFKLGSKAPVWIPDARVSMCMLCTAEFTRTFRRHHCRACGKVVCAYCSDCRAPLRYLMYRSARACIECFEKLAKDVEVMEDIADSSGGAQEVCDRSSGPFSKSNIMARFKGIRLGSFGRGSGHSRQRPAILSEVTANDENADMSGYLKVWKGKKWKKMWFVVKDKALFTFKASEDLAATESTVLLGYEVRTYHSSEINQSPGRNPLWFQGIEANLVFKLTHKGTESLTFRTESPLSRDRWMVAMRNASIP